MGAGPHYSPPRQMASGRLRIMRVGTSLAQATFSFQAETDRSFLRHAIFIHFYNQAQPRRHKRHRSDPAQLRVLSNAIVVRYSRSFTRSIAAWTQRPWDDIRPWILTIRIALVAGKDCALGSGQRRGDHKFTKFHHSPSPKCCRDTTGSPLRTNRQKGALSKGVGGVAHCVKKPGHPGWNTSGQSGFSASAPRTVWPRSLPKGPTLHSGPRGTFLWRQHLAARGLYSPLGAVKLAGDFLPVC